MPSRPLDPAAIGPRSRRRRLLQVDGRTRAAKYHKSIEDALLRHVGGPEQASVPQRILIGRIASDCLRLELLDQRMLADEASEYEHRIASALRHHVRLGLVALGIDKADPVTAKPSVGEYLVSLASNEDHSK